jgi:hypothetical protein
VAKPERKPKIWVRVVEAHAQRTWVAVILSVAGGVSLVMLVAGAVWNTVATPGVTDLATNFSSTIATILGTLIGSLAGYIAGSAVSAPGVSESPPPGLRDDEIVLDVEEPGDDQ